MKNRLPVHSCAARTLKFFLVLIPAVFVTTFCLSAETEEGDETEPLEVVTLQLKWKHQFQFAGYYAALEKGYYREAGLDVNIVEASAEEKSEDKVIDGDADFGIAMSDLVQLRASGKPVVALAAIFQHSPLVILARKSSGIESIHDLKGKKISLETHSEELLIYLESEGLPPRELIIYPHDYDITKLIAGEVDAISAYSTDEPFLLLQNGIQYSTFSPRAAGIDFYGDTLFTSESQIREHPERVSAFLEASLKGWQYALDNPEEIVDLILAKHSTRHSREHLLFEAQKTKRLIMKDVIEIGYMNPGRWEYIVTSFKELSLIPADFSLDGFIYDRNPPRDLRWLYTGLFGTIVLAGLAMLLVLKFYRMNQRLKWEATERLKHIAQLKKANDQIRVLKGIVPICMHCKGIRDDQGYWNELEDYISTHSDVQFSHGICEKCLKNHYGD